MAQLAALSRPTITFSDGMSMPQVGLGLWQTPANVTAGVVRTAIETGYRSLDTAIDFYCNKLGLREISRKEVPQGRYTLAFLAAPGGDSAQVELTHNWDPQDYPGGRNFGHLAYAVEDIYAACRRLMEHGVTINRPPRDGRMAFVRSPDNISIELLQKGAALPPAEPWTTMANTGIW